MSDTHVNAYRMELQEAEIAETQAHSRVLSLKKTIKAMEAENPIETPTEAPVETPAVETPKAMPTAPVEIADPTTVKTDEKAKV